MTAAVLPAQNPDQGLGRAPVDFTRQVRPILSQHCFACHGPDQEAREADLSLVTRAAATANRPDGPAIVAGDRDGSLIWRRINDASSPMPPVEQHNALTAEQIDVLGRWIAEGASYAPHWAYVPPREVPAPAVRETSWPLDPIDAFVLARLEAEGLAHAPAADPVTLARRLTFDLSGLPPTAAAVDEFVAAFEVDRRAACEALVDRLLASYHFGERMAVPWLDLVRYADTVGYHGDQEHNVWPYREWVIRAFHDNMPFDQFTIEQLAGDLLPEPTQDQLIATGYNRLLQTTHEGGLQLEEYRAIYLADRVRNVSAVWMGATLGCAQCHDHKYDPYTARDFYAFGAFFADIDDEEHLRRPYNGLNTSPTKRVPEMRVVTPDVIDRRRQIGRDRAAVESELELAIAALPGQQDAWEAALRAEIAGFAERRQVWIDDALDTGGKASGDWNFVSEGVRPHSGTKVRVQRAKAQIQHYTSATERRLTVAPEDVLYAWVYIDPASVAKAVMLQFYVDGDWSHRAVWGSDDITYGRRPKSWQGYRRMGPLPASGQWACLEVKAKEVGLKAGERVNGWAFTQWGGTVYWDDAGARTSIAPEDVAAALEVPAAERSASQRSLLASHHEKTAAEVIALRARLRSLEDAALRVENSMPKTLVTKALAEPRTVRILPRGNWLDASGPVVEPAIPTFLGALSSEGRPGRLDLARWLVASEGGVGGLTARVFVNRVWAMLFGTGLCPSPEDFGGQGKPPNHLALLDRLAIDFVESGWDVKALVRRLVLSRSYQQASMARADVIERDPLNELFARQSRERLPAEMIRDTALMVSGLLVDRIGGASAKPPQPAGYYRHLNFPQRRYRSDQDQARWRRGVYVHWQRQFLHPMMRAFDAPTREECTAQRPISNTPSAALTLLNDPVFVEAARAFAQRALQAELASDADRIKWAMREATARVPSAGEVAVLGRLLAAGRRHFQGNPQAAAALLAVGDAARDPSLPKAEHAAWTQVMRAILNLHETICRD